MMESLQKLIEYLGGAAVLIAFGRWLWWLYLRDATAAERCSEIVCKFRRNLENFGSYLQNNNRHPDKDFPKLLELKPLLEEFRLKKRGLLFKPYSLRSVQKSLKLFSRLSVHSPANKPNIIASELMMEWGIPAMSPYEAVKLLKLQEVLEKPSLLRWIYGIFSWIKPLRKHLENFFSKNS